MTEHEPIPQTSGEMGGIPPRRPAATGRMENERVEEVLALIRTMNPTELRTFGQLVRITLLP